MIIVPVYHSGRVVNGYFTAQVNTSGEFGEGAFNGEARWLQIAVECTGDAAYIPLSPRQPLTPAPYALALPGLYTQPNATSPNVIGGYSGNTETSGLSGATIGGGGTSGNINSVTGNFGTVSGGYSNTASFMYAMVGGGYGNIASNSDATVSGGENNTASGDTASVGGGISNTAGGAQTSVDGGYSNTAGGDYSTVSGCNGNNASGDHAIVSGGDTNTALFTYATVGGGFTNNANDMGSTVSGGSNNTATFDYYEATVAGGFGNTSGGDYATVGGGYSNLVNGHSAVVPGGSNNIASGSNSFAAGQQAQANHNSAFVWADSANSIFASTAINQFLIRAGGGVGINTNITTPNNLNVNGQIIAGGIAAPAGSEPFVSHGSYSGISMDDRLAGANPCWVIYTNNGSLLFYNGVNRAGFSNVGVLAIGGLGSAVSTDLCLNAWNQIASCSSSLRYKDNVVGLSLGLDTIAKLRPVTFDRKGTGEHDLGFVAEEVNKVMSMLTTRNSDGQIEGVKYDRISAVLVNAVQEQQKQIAALQAQVAALKQGSVNAAASPLSTPWPWLALVTVILGGLAITRR